MAGFKTSTIVTRGLMLASLLTLLGCEEPVQSYSPKGQTRDYKVCKDAGMGARLDFWNIVRCVPPTIQPGSY